MKNSGFTCVLIIHCCQYENDKTLDEKQFDSSFVLLLRSLVAIPVYVKHNITFREGSSQGRFDLTLGPKQTMGKAVESVLVSSQLPRGVLNANLNPSQGTYTFDPVTKVHRVCLCLRSWYCSYDFTVVFSDLLIELNSKFFVIMIFAS